MKHFCPEGQSLSSPDGQCDPIRHVFCVSPHSFAQKDVFSIVLYITGAGVGLYILRQGEAKKCI